MRDDWGVVGVADGDEVFDHAGDGIGHPVREMAACVAESDSGECGSEQHFAASLVVVGIMDRPPHVRRHHLDGLRGPYVADWIRALVRRARAWVCGRFPPIVREGGKGLETVAQNIKSAARRHHRRESAGIVGVDDSHVGPQRAVRDSGLGANVEEIEDRYAGSFAAGAGRRWDGYERLQGTRRRFSSSDGSVDICKKIGRICGVQVSRLCGIHAGAAADRDEAVEGTVGRELDGMFERSVRRLDTRAVVQYYIDACSPEGAHGHLDRLAPSHALVCHEHDAAAAQAAHLEPDLSRNAGSVLDAGSVHRERGLVGHAVIASTSVVASPPRLRSGDGEARLSSQNAVCGMDFFCHERCDRAHIRSIYDRDDVERSHDDVNGLHAFQIQYCVRHGLGLANGHLDQHVRFRSH